MRILVTFAVEAEFAPWRKLRQFSPVPIRVVPRDSGPVEIWEAYVGDVIVSVYLTGIAGRLPLEGMQMREAFFHDKPTFAISSGLAGALKPCLVVGEVFVARETWNANGLKTHSADDGLLSLAKTAGATVIQRLVSTDHIVRKKAEKTRLGELSDAVDMESAVILKDFDTIQLPAIAIRAVSDGFSEDLPIDFSRCITAEGKVRTPELLWEIASCPSAIPALVRFGKQSKKAADRLVSFLDRFILTASGSPGFAARQEVAAR